MYLFLFSADRLLCCLSSCCLLFVSDAAGIEFDRGALEHKSALDDATVAVEDRCSTVVNSLAKAKEVLGRFYQELFSKGASLEDVGALAEALSAEAKERLQQEAADREEQLATVAAARERGVAAKLMAAAKAISGEC